MLLKLATCAHDESLKDNICFIKLYLNIAAFIAAPAGLFAIEIMAMCPGGAWRTLSEWKQLFNAAGLDLASNTAVGCNMSLMVWRPRPVLG
jgi:hypothetical protein